MLAAGGHIQLRPSVDEAVAPYVTPQTPPTKNLSAEEAQGDLHRDWLHQADQDPSPDGSSKKSGGRTSLPSESCPVLPARLISPARSPNSTRCRKQVAALTAPDAELYFKVRAVKRTIAFKNPVVDFSKVLFVDMPFPQGNEWPHETRHRLGYMAVPGARLLVLDGLTPPGTLTKLMPTSGVRWAFSVFGVRALGVAGEDQIALQAGLGFRGIAGEDDSDRIATADGRFFDGHAFGGSVSSRYGLWGRCGTRERRLKFTVAPGMRRTGGRVATRRAVPLPVTWARSWRAGTRWR